MPVIARHPWSSRAPRILAAAALIALAACSESTNSPQCVNCEAWDQVSRGLGRFPAPHPSNAAVIAFSTVDKTPGAPDASRESDEDLWLTWIVNADDPTQNPVWQLTGDELEGGDNLYPRWSPGGDELAFVHIDATGHFEVWRMPVTPPASAGGEPVVGTPEFISRGRDPAWASADRLVITRGDKLVAIDLAGATRGGNREVQLSFDPPLYASSDDYIDRHPDFAPDGGAIFNALGRQNTADVAIEAYEVDREVTPAETVATAAFLLYQPPDGTPSYPLFEGPDTLRTPALIRSLPISGGGEFRLGVALDPRFLATAESTLANFWRRSYCDTTISQLVSLQPNAADTLRYYFDIVRGTLRIRTFASRTTIFWTRLDGRASSGDVLLVNAGDYRDWPCLLSYEVVGGVPTPPALETYLVTASSDGFADFDTTVVLVPGDTTIVNLYPPPAGTGDAPGPLRLVRASSVFESVSGRSVLPELRGMSLSALRAADDEGSVWRLQLEGDRARFSRLVGSPGLIQNPALSREIAGVRYLAYATNEEGEWDLRVQRLLVEGSGASASWDPDGAPLVVATPGSIDNLDCTRNVMHPRFAEGSAPGTLRLIVAMSDCPDNGFEDLGIDDDPWAIGELRVWQVEIASP